jgi:hypothetical protein
LELEVARGAQV